MIVKVNYLNNKELLAEIHKSKLTFCHLAAPQYGQYDAIVDSLDQITPELIQTTREQRAVQIYQTKRQELKEQGYKNHQIKVEAIDPMTVTVESLVWRVMTYDHIPLDDTRAKRPKNEREKHTKLNFEPFKHYKYDENGEFVEVGRSHWKGNLTDGHFSQIHGRITHRLGMMFMKLVEKYSQRSNWRGYTYVDEMRSQALLQLSLVGLQFDESRSDNPFAYYTVTVSNAFTRVLNLEKRNQNIRDDILIMHGASPSMTRQIDNELAQKAQADAAATVEDSDIPAVPVEPAKDKIKKSA